MKLIFEKEMDPKLIDQWNFYVKFIKGLNSFMGPPDEPECHTFVYHVEKNYVETDMFLHNGMAFLRGIKKCGWKLNEVHAFVFWYDIAPHKGYAIWFAPDHLRATGAIRKSCDRVLSDAGVEFVKREEKARNDMKENSKNG